MTETARLYHSSISELGYTSAKRKASDNHNLRNDPENRNVIHSKTKNNILFINGKKCNPLDTENNFELVQKTCNDLKKDFQAAARKNNQNTTLSEKNKAALQIDRTKLKSKIKKWSENNKANPDEIAFFKRLYSDIGNKELNSSELITELQSFGKSVKRFNDKKKAISGLDNLNKLIGTNSININLSLITKELVYKIPDQWEKEIKPEDLLRFARKLNKKYYTDFNAIYEAVHCDEQSPHIHIRLSGLNNETKQFDMQNSLLKKVRYFDKQNRLPENKKYSELTKEEVKLFGEVYQELIFDDFNTLLKHFEYDFKVKKRTAEEKKDDWNKFKDSKLKIADREYNLQNKLADENNKSELLLNKTNNKVKNNNETIDIQNKVIEEKNTELTNLNIEIEEKKTLLESIQSHCANAWSWVVEYAQDKCPTRLKNYLVEQSALDEINKEIGDQIHRAAINVQLTAEQKEQVRKARPSLKR